MFIGPTCRPIVDALSYLFRNPIVRSSLSAAGALLATLPMALAAQSTVSGRVVDAYNRAPLGGVQITSNSGGSATSASDGTFMLPCTTGMEVEFRVLGYDVFKTTVADCSRQLLNGLTAGTQNLNAVNVVASREAPSVSQPLSVSTLSQRELNRGTGLFLDDALNAVPGVRMERRTMSGGQRITIRGYGNRTNFDGTGYKALLNGVPITDAEGVTMLDDIDFATLGKVDVIRGPASSLYGAGIAGVVNLQTLRPDRAGTAFEQDVQGGADGLLRTDTRYTSVTSGSTILANYGHQDYDSYRVHSESKKDHVMLLGDFRPSERRTVSGFLTYAHSYEGRAGQLDSAEFFNKLNVGEAPYLNNDGHLDMETIRVGVTHSYRHTKGIESVVTGYLTGVNREDVFAVGLNPRSNQTFGGRAVLNTTFMNGSLPISGSTGIDYQKTNQFAKSYGYANKIASGITTDLETHNMQYSAFSQWDVSLPAAFMVTAGASVNFVEYALVDRLTNTGNPAHKDLTGRQVYDPVVMPHVALLRMFGNDRSVYASYSQGFTPSTSSDAVIAFTGLANSGLKSERGSQVELGTKGSLLDRRLSYQVALFNLKITDKLTSQSVFNDAGTQLYSYTVNAGDQSNKGAEVAASFNVLNAPAGVLTVLRPFVSYTYSDFKYDNFRSNNNNNSGTVDYSGNEVAGVPKHVYTVGADASFQGGLYATGTAEHRGVMPLTFDNVHSAPAYTLVNGRAGVRRDLSAHVGIDGYLGAQNLTNSLYYTMAFLNGNYANNASPKIYLPGPTTARLFGGLKLSIRP